MVPRPNKTLISLSVFLVVWAWNTSAATVKGEAGIHAGKLSGAQIEEQLQVGNPILRDLYFEYAQPLFGIEISW